MNAENGQEEKTTENSGNSSDNEQGMPKPEEQSAEPNTPNNQTTRLNK